MDLLIKFISALTKMHVKKDFMKMAINARKDIQVLFAVFVMITMKFITNNWMVINVEIVYLQLLMSFEWLAI